WGRAGRHGLAPHAGWAFPRRGGGPASTRWYLHCPYWDLPLSDHLLSAVDRNVACDRGVSQKSARIRHPWARRSSVSSIAEGGGWLPPPGWGGARVYLRTTLSSSPRSSGTVTDSSVASSCRAREYAPSVSSCERMLSAITTAPGSSFVRARAKSFS